MKPKTRFIQLLFGNLLLITFILGSGFYITSRIMINQANSLSLRFQEDLLTLIQHDLEKHWADKDTLIPRYCEIFAATDTFNPALRLTVVSDTGKVLGDSRFSADKMPLHNTAEQPEIINVLEENLPVAARRFAVSTRLSQTAGISYRYAAAVVRIDNKTAAVVRIAAPVSELSFMRNRILFGITVSFGIMLLFAVALFTLYSRDMYNPLNRAMQETERVKADFVANTSHELRTPLTTIRATLDNITDGVCSEPEAMQSALNILAQNVSRLEALTDDLLSLHYTEQESFPNRFEKTTIREQKEILEELFTVKAVDKKIHLSIESAQMEKEFSTDRKRFELILQNLTDNAVKFTPAGGKVILSFSLERSGVLVFQCIDTGCGIAVEEQNRIFERFYRVSRSGSKVAGTGLGLAIVKHSVERLGGTLALVSQPDCGSSFTVRIPVMLFEQDNFYREKNTPAAFTENAYQPVKLRG